MSNIVLSAIAIILYALACLSYLYSLRYSFAYHKLSVVVLGFIAVVIHAMLLHQWIDVPAGQNLTVFNMLSLLAWLVSLFALIIILVRSIDILVLLTFPLAMLSILLVLIFPSEFIIATSRNFHNLFHIIFSIITFAMVWLAGLQALLLALQDRYLRLRPNSELIRRLPPLMTMERLLFALVVGAFILLSILLLSSLYFFYPLLFSDGWLIQKTILVISAWAVFAILLLGRYCWGWRGRKAIYFTLSAVLLLIIVYFSSRLAIG